MTDFKDTVDITISDKILKAASDPEREMKRLLKVSGLVSERAYVRLICKNIQFMQEKPVNIMVTATMSAGKSTFINALTGKYICLSQNMACTSKIHRIVNKAFEDGFAAEYDHDLVLTAGKEELLNDNEQNSSDKILVSTNFEGFLSDRRVIVSDSPGVNYSGNAEHKHITERLLRAKKYDLLIYVMNATQLATNDEREHLEFVRKIIGRMPVLFVINKIDSLNIEEENILDILKRQIAMLENCGFKKPMVCPVSARAGYLAKQFRRNKLSRSESRELYNYVDKFDEMKLCDYYSGMFKNIKIKNADKEEDQLLKTCGLAYVEKIIIKACKGEI